MYCTVKPHLHCTNCNKCGKLNHIHGHGCPPPVRPVHIAPGHDGSVWNAVQRLECTVNQCVDQANGVLKRACDTLGSLKHHASENGAYYDREIWTEEGYDSGTGSKYFITHKKAVDCKGTPIRMELKLAYDNTTNSKVKQDAFVASEYELANLMFPAINVNDATGWYGHTTWQGAPVPSTDIPGLYTVGFTKSGQMKYYDNHTDPSQLRKDCIQNSMGVPGVLVVGGDVSPIEMRQQIPDSDKNRARVCMGQNFETGEVIFLSCGEYDSNGMTSLAAAHIMKKYGCDLAVETCTGSDVCALDKGQMLFKPDKATVPAVYAYWFVTKRREYCSDFTKEVALLMQRVGQANWTNSINTDAIMQNTKDISLLFERQNLTAADLEEVKKKIQTLENQLQILQSYNEFLGSEVDNLHNKLLDETNNRIAEDQKLFDKITKEIADRQSAIQNLEASISGLNSQLTVLIENLRSDLTKETSERKADVVNLQNQIDSLRTIVSDHTTEIAGLQAELLELSNRVTSNFNTMKTITSSLRDDVSALEVRQTALEKQMTSLDRAVTEYLINLAEIESALSNLKADVASLHDAVNKMDTKIMNFERRMSDIEYNVGLLQNNVAQLNAWKAEIDSHIAIIDASIAEIYSDYGVLEVRVKNLEDAQRDYNAKFLEIYEQITNITNAITSMQDRLSAVEDDMADVVGGIDDLKPRVDALDQKAVDHDIAIGNNRDNITTAFAAIDELDGEVVNLENNMVVVKDRLKEIDGLYVPPLGAPAASINLVLVNADTGVDNVNASNDVPQKTLRGALRWLSLRMGAHPTWSVVPTIQLETDIRVSSDSACFIGGSYVQSVRIQSLTPRKTITVTTTGANYWVVNNANVSFSNCNIVFEKAAQGFRLTNASMLFDSVDITPPEWVTPYGERYVFYGVNSTICSANPSDYSGYPLKFLYPGYNVVPFKLKGCDVRGGFQLDSEITSLGSIYYSTFLTENYTLTGHTFDNVINSVILPEVP